MAKIRTWIWTSAAPRWTLCAACASPGIRGQCRRPWRCWSTGTAGCAPARCGACPGWPALETWKSWPRKRQQYSKMGRGQNGQIQILKAGQIGGQMNLLPGNEQIKRSARPKFVWTMVCPTSGRLRWPRWLSWCPARGTKMWLDTVNSPGEAMDVFLPYKNGVGSMLLWGYSAPAFWYTFSIFFACENWVVEHSFASRHRVLVCKPNKAPSRIYPLRANFASRMLPCVFPYVSTS